MDNLFWPFDLKIFRGRRFWNAFHWLYYFPFLKLLLFFLHFFTFWGRIIAAFIIFNWFYNFSSLFLGWNVILRLFVSTWVLTRDFLFNTFIIFLFPNCLLHFLNWLIRLCFWIFTQLNIFSRQFNIARNQWPWFSLHDVSSSLVFFFRWWRSFLWFIFLFTWGNYWLFYIKFLIIFFRTIYFLYCLVYFYYLSLMFTGNFLVWENTRFKRTKMLWNCIT